MKQARSNMDRFSFKFLKNYTIQASTDKSSHKKWSFVKALLCIQVSSHSQAQRIVSLDLGDLRTFQAVDCVGLHHIFDCIVFPSKGDRPHPNELSGSDLDGDLYHVIWDEQLVPTVPNKEAMDYSALPLQTHNTSVTTDDILFFLQQVRSVGTHSRDCVLQNIQYDCLGQIDNMHKALADQLGIQSQPCIELARLHSLARFLLFSERGKCRRRWMRRKQDNGKTFHVRSGSYSLSIPISWQRRIVLPILLKRFLE